MPKHPKTSDRIHAPSCLGLLGMRERALSLGGTLHIEQHRPNPVLIAALFYGILNWPSKTNNDAAKKYQP